MNLYLARPQRGLRDALRELRGSFSVTTGPQHAETREYLDTFDWRLFRAGMFFARVGERLLLADAISGEQTAQGAWHDAAPPRFARDLPTDDLRRFVSSLTDPRALLFAARARVAVRTVEVRGAGGTVVAGLRFESATVRSGKRVRRLNGLLVDAAAGGSARGAGAAVSAALSRAGFRASSAGWFETIVRAAGCRPGEYSTRPGVEIAPGAPARTVVAGIYRSLYEVMRQNETGVREDIDPEFLHDFRVALRRTRTGLTELKGVLPADIESEFRERLRVLAEPTGKVRDLDVHLARRSSYLSRLPDELRPGLAAIFAAMERDRALKREELLAVLASRQYALLKRDWKRAIDALADGTAVGIDAETPAIGIGRRAIRKRYERMGEIAAAAEALDDAALHRARLNGKKLRYLIEFFQDGLGRKTSALLERMEGLQDALGEFTDLGVQLRVFRNALATLPDGAPEPYARAAALGGIIAMLDARRRKIRRRCERLLEILQGPIPPGLD